MLKHIGTAAILLGMTMLLTGCDYPNYPDYPDYSNNYPPVSVSYDNGYQPAPSGHYGPPSSYGPAPSGHYGPPMPSGPSGHYGPPSSPTSGGHYGPP